MITSTLTRARPAVRRGVLHDTTLLITGCNTGIGRELARQSLTRGARLVFTCRSEDKVASTTSALRSEFPQGEVAGYRLDMSEGASVDRLTHLIEADGLEIDALILNAGVHVPFVHHVTVWDQRGNSAARHHILESCARALAIVFDGVSCVATS